MARHWQCEALSGHCPAGFLLTPLASDQILTRACQSPQNGPACNPPFAGGVPLEVVRAAVAKAAQCLPAQLAAVESVMAQVLTYPLPT